MAYRRILLIIGGMENTIGGHTLSALTLGKYLFKLGYDVGMILAPIPYPVPELDLCPYRLHYVKCLPGKGAILTRPRDILKIVQEYNYDTLVAMDWYAGLYAGLAVIKFKMPLVQVIAGGKGPPSDPLDLPGIVVFSEELMKIIPEKYGISPERLIFSPGRVDFEAYKTILHSSEDSNSLGFSPSSPRVLAVSRLKFNKAPAIKALLKQVEEVAIYQPIQCFVIGEGDSRQMLEEEASRIIDATNRQADIRFLGGFRVSGKQLREADLVIGQGRTVLEAIASGVPAAVCGEKGYFGLITPQTFPLFSVTNFTGRQLNPFSTLFEDCQKLDHFIKFDNYNVYVLAQEKYDADVGAIAIENAINKVHQYYLRININRKNLIYIWIKTYFIALRTLLKRRLRVNQHDR